MAWSAAKRGRQEGVGTNARRSFDLRRIAVRSAMRPSPAVPRERAQESNYRVLLWNRVSSERNTEGFMELVSGVLLGKMPMM